MHTTNILVGLVLKLIYIFAQAPVKVSGEPVKIGRFYECAHGLKGTVHALNDREILITGFHYNGGPDASFHGQLKGSKGKKRLINLILNKNIIN